MPNRNFRFITLILVVLLPVAPLYAQDAVTPAPYVSVSLEVNGLAESADVLNDAMRELSATLSELAASPEDLTPEQLAAFAELTQEMTLLVAALDQTLQGLAPAIRRAEAPMREVLTGVIETARVEAIEPTLAAVDRRVRNWLILAVVGAVLVVGMTGLGLFLSARQLKVMASLLRSVADDYEIVPRRVPIAPEPAAPQTAATERGPAVPEPDNG